MSSPKLIVLITGANTGIGYHTAIHLAKTGRFTVLVGARSKEKAEAAISDIKKDQGSITDDTLVPLAINLTDDTSIDAAARWVGEAYGRLDILINNAGIAALPSGGDKDNARSSLRERFSAILDTNVTGTACVTEAFIPLILMSTSPAPARRIVNVGTGLASLTLVKDRKKPADPQYTEYSVSKAAINMLSWHTLRRLEAEEVTVIVASPGHCATNLNEGRGVDTPENGGRYVAQAAIQGGFEDQNGKFYDKGQEIPW